MDFICPKCRGELSPGGASYICPSGHTFDVARAGYINLLPPSGPSGHGDNKEMLTARRRFLDTGHYLPLAERICELAKKYIKPHSAVIDVGCGEGYYTDKLERMLAMRDGDSRVSALDISKDAVRYAGARNKSVSCAVASAYDVPSRDGAFSAAVNVFSPLAREEMLRILDTGGVFIVAFPAEEHLFGLKAAIYDTPYKNEPQPLYLDGFELLWSERVTYTVSLTSSEQIRDLFMMTPYAYRTKNENKERVLSLSSLKTEADFYICVYKKV